MNEIEENDDPIYLLIREQVKDISTEKLSDQVDQTPSYIETEKQLVYIWLRLYVKDEVEDIKEGDNIYITYSPTGEKLQSKFICFGKKNSIRDAESEDQIQMSQEDDPKCLILMVNEETIQTGDDIPFIRSLFKISRHYEFQVYRREELIFINQRTGETIQYYDCDF
jgi:hypothetical protein